MPLTQRWQCVAGHFRQTQLSRMSLFGLIFLSGFWIFLIAQYLSFGIWDSPRYLTADTCLESTYIFRPSPKHTAVWDDSNLHKICYVTTDVTNDKMKRIRTRLKAWEKPSDSPPKITTKCGSSTPILVSRWRLRSNRTKIKDNDSLRVPNIVHYVSIGHWEFSFLNYVSFRSVDLFIKPHYIFLIGNGLPYGSWWNRTISEVSNIYFVYHRIPERIQGRRPQWREHMSDVLRIQTLFYNGGIYLDTDVIVLRSFDPLRKYETTLGRETYYGLGSSIIVAQQLAAFTCLWLHAYRDYNPFPWNWAYYAVHIPNRLASKFPDIIHLEERKLLHPSWEEWELLFQGSYDWSQNYAIHVWKRYGRVPTAPQQIEKLNTTLGEIMRYVYFGSKQLIR